MFSNYRAAITVLGAAAMFSIEHNLNYELHELSSINSCINNNNPLGSFMGTFLCCILHDQLKASPCTSGVFLSLLEGRQPYKVGACFCSAGSVV